MSEPLTKFLETLASVVGFIITYIFVLWYTGHHQPEPVTSQQVLSSQAVITDTEVRKALRTAVSGVTEDDVIEGNITFYDICVKCCGKTDGVTHSGKVIYNGMDDPHIVACNWLPFGSIVEIDGQEYTVADTGGSGLDEIGRLDVFVPQGHEYALQMGRVYPDIKIIYIEVE